jgi:aminopeptidase N
VEQIFDGISYGKGAAFLKQLHYVLGHEKFKAALHIYFQKHQWKNTELTDFISVMETAYYTMDEKPFGDNLDFKKWSDSWLKTSGVNTLTP